MARVSERGALLPEQHASAMVKHVSVNHVALMMNCGQLREHKKAHIPRKTWQTRGVLRF